MSNYSTRSILNRRPNIIFVAPRSGLTIPEPERNTTPQTPKEKRVEQLIQNLVKVSVAAEAIEAIISERAKGEVLKLDLSNPEDVIVAQAAARCFPEVANGALYVEEITFPMYSSCIQKMKAAGKAAGGKQQITAPESFQANKTDFGGQGKDRRPDVNKTTIPFAPIDIPAFIAAGIPLLFGMLMPLINVAIKKDIIGHFHVDPISGVVGPGVPVIP